MRRAEGNERSELRSCSTAVCLRGLIDDPYLVSLITRALVSFPGPVNLRLFICSLEHRQEIEGVACGRKQTVLTREILSSFPSLNSILLPPYLIKLEAVKPH